MNRRNAACGSMSWLDCPTEGSLDSEAKVSPPGVTVVVLVGNVRVGDVEVGAVPVSAVSVSAVPVDAAPAGSGAAGEVELLVFSAAVFVGAVFAGRAGDDVWSVELLMPPTVGRRSAAG
jgi:hypothetical protein